jgi:hypothetical protein
VAEKFGSMDGPWGESSDFVGVEDVAIDGLVDVDRSLGFIVSVIVSTVFEDSDVVDVIAVVVVVASSELTAVESSGLLGSVLASIEVMSSVVVSIESMEPVVSSRRSLPGVVVSCS